MYILGFVLAGLEFRFGWLPLPDWVSPAAAVVFLVSCGFYGEVLRENAYLSRTVEVQEHQTVVDTGLYGLIRHPVYSVTLWMFLSVPLVPGSLPSLPVFLFYPAIIVRRIRDEELLLERELKGYRDYEKKVKYRRIPFVL